MRQQRILITPREIAGVSAGLQAMLAGRGHHVDVLLRWRHPFSYIHARARSRVLRLMSRFVVEEEDAAHPRRQRVVSLAVRLMLLPLIARRYDAVVYVGPDTLLRGGRDRRWLHGRGLTIVTVFCGTEARPPYMDGWYAGADSTATLAEVRSAVTRNRERVQQAERDSTYVLTHAACGQFLQMPFLDWTVVGFAQREQVPASTAPRSADAPLVVLHAPSVPRMKGTAQIRAAMAHLQEEMDVEYVEVTGRSHAEVQSLLAGADLVVDQLYSDYALPGFATEAARSGTPALVFGYAAELVNDAARRTSGPTDHYTTPDALLPALRRVLSDTTHRASIAQQLHDFVTVGHWSHPAIGARWERILAADADPDWFDQPLDIVYASGCAVSDIDQAAHLRNYLAAYGVGALELEHHPALVAALLEIARR